MVFLRVVLPKELPVWVKRDCLRLRTTLGPHAFYRHEAVWEMWSSPKKRRFFNTLLHVAKKHKGKRSSRKWREGCGEEWTKSMLPGSRFRA